MLAAAGSAQIIRDTFESRIQSSAGRSSSRSSLRRRGRQQDDGSAGGVDFSGCVTDQETGLCCVDKVT